eukprot:Hpha_TRINITY_DN30652_c0_g1::TRINITY_DN30652_c0_g1_i1::g.18297::m.18297
MPVHQRAPGWAPDAGIDNLLFGDRSQTILEHVPMPTCEQVFLATLCAQISHATADAGTGELHPGVLDLLLTRIVAPAVGLESPPAWPSFRAAVEAVEAVAGGDDATVREALWQVKSQWSKVGDSLSGLFAMLTHLGGFVKDSVGPKRGGEGSSEGSDEDMEGEERVLLQPDSAAGVFLRRVVLWWQTAAFDQQDKLYLTMRQWCHSGEQALPPAAGQPEQGENIPSLVSAAGTSGGPAGEAAKEWMRCKSLADGKRLVDALSSCTRYADITCGCAPSLTGVRLAAGCATVQMAEIMFDFGDRELARQYLGSAMRLGQSAGEENLVLVIEGRLAELELQHGDVPAAAARLLRLLRTSPPGNLQAHVLAALLCVNHPRFAAAKADHLVPLLPELGSLKLPEPRSTGLPDGGVIGVMVSGSEPTPAGANLQRAAGFLPSEHLDPNEGCAHFLAPTALWQVDPLAIGGGQDPTVLAWRALWGCELALAKVRREQTNHLGHAEEPLAEVVPLLRSRLLQRLGLWGAASAELRGSGAGCRPFCTDAVGRESVLHQLQVEGNPAAAVRRVEEMLRREGKVDGELRRLASFVLACWQLHVGEATSADETARLVLGEDPSELPTATRPLVLWPYLLLLRIKCARHPPADERLALSVAVEARGRARRLRWCQWEALFLVEIARCYVRTALPEMALQHLDDAKAVARAAQCHTALSAAEVLGLHVDIGGGELTKAVRRLSSSVREREALLTTAERAEVSTFLARAYSTVAAETARTGALPGASVSAPQTSMLPQPRYLPDGGIDWGVLDAVGAADAAVQWAALAQEQRAAAGGLAEEVAGRLVLVRLCELRASLAGESAERSRECAAQADQATAAARRLRAAAERPAAACVAARDLQTLLRAAVEKGAGG